MSKRGRVAAALLRNPALALGAGLALSVGLHAAVIAALSWTPPTPDLGLTWQWPAEVEFGVSEAVSLGPQNPASQAPQPELNPPAAAGAGGSKTGDAGRRRDGAPTKRRVRRRGKQRRVGDGGRSRRARLDKRAGHGEQQTMPPGAHIALRVDMRRLKNSSRADAVREILKQSPDWKALLAGSGLDPLSDLDRILLASPDFRNRRRLVMAGSYRGGRGAAQDVVERMAAANGKQVAFTDRRGLPAAEWPAPDAVQRTVVLIGERHFVIAPAADVDAVLAMAVGRQQRDTDGGLRGRPLSEGLLALPAGEMVHVTVDGARRYAQVAVGRGASPDDIPLRLEIGLQELPSGRVQLRATGRYPSRRQARGALAFWTQMRDRAAASPILRYVMRMAEPIEGITLTVKGRDLSAQTELGPRHANVLLGYVRELVVPRRPTPPRPTAPTGPPTGTEESLRSRHRGSAAQD